MSSDVNQLLHDIAASTMEELCFMFEEPDMDEELFHLKNGKVSIIKFTGPFSGTMVLKASGDLLEAIGVNMLGEDELTEEQKRDALGEVSNVICGNVLPNISGSKKDVFDLASPEVYNIDEMPEIGSEDQTTTVRIPMEDGFIEIQLIKNF